MAKTERCDGCCKRFPKGSLRRDDKDAALLYCDDCPSVEHILTKGKPICGFKGKVARGIDIQYAVNNPCISVDEGTCPECIEVFLKRGVNVKLGR